MPRQVRKSCSVVHLSSSGVTGSLALNLALLMITSVLFYGVTHGNPPQLPTRWRSPLPGLLGYLESHRRATQPSQRGIGNNPQLELPKTASCLHGYLSPSVLIGRGQVMQSEVLRKTEHTTQLSNYNQNPLVSEPVFVKVNVPKQLTKR